MNKRNDSRIAFFLLCLMMCLLRNGMEAEAASGVTQTGIAEKSAVIAWQRQGEEASYEIYVWMPSSSWEGNTLYTDYSLEFLGETVNTTYTVNGLKGGYLYNAVIRSYDGEGSFLYDTECSFETLPAKGDITTSLKWSSYTTRKVNTSTTKTMSYNLYVDITSQESADGYEIQLTDCKREKDKLTKRKVTVKAKTGSLQRYTFKNLKDSIYSVKVRAYMQFHGRTYYGGWSDLSYALRQPMCAAKPYQNQVYIKWEPVPKATGYDIYMSDGKRTVYRKVKTASSNTRMVLIKKWNGKKFKTNGTYYYYVVAKKKVGKNTYESVLSYRYKVKIK